MSPPRESDWKALVSGSFRQLQDLLEYCEVEHLQVETRDTPDFALRVTKYFASLIEKGNARDPLLLQVLPLALESRVVDGYHRDAVGDHLSMPIPGLIHKYRNRVLLTLTGACPIHCRYCFRRHFPYSENNTDFAADGEVIKYLLGNTEIEELILSGGDPLMLSDRKLANLMVNLNRVPHIRSLRIHTRLLSVLPERVNETFLDVLRQFHGQVVFVTHINHANEISAHNRAVFKKLNRQGYRLFNQSVLLKGVNDSSQILSELSKGLFESWITPYYLHRLDKVQGAAHFAVGMKESCDIYQQLREKLPGYLLPAFVEEVAGRTSKTPVVCD